MHTPTEQYRSPRKALSYGACWAGGLICLAVLVFILTGAAQTTPNPCRSINNPVLTALPDANKQMEINAKAQGDKNYAAANAERRKQIADDTARLVKLATELKAAVDKTNKDTLSLDVIRKADEIEKIAHGVKEKMKLTVGAS
ncbi:MAG: hypothetical protein ABR928_22575 [Terracidiphilus sp.]